VLRRLRDGVKAAMLDESGQGMVEYIIIVVVVAIAAIVAWRILGQKAREKIIETASSLGRL